MVLTDDDTKWIDENVREVRHHSYILFPEDQKRVIEVAKLRTDNNKKAGTYRPPFDGQDEYNVDLQGLGAEVAFCRICGYEPDWTTEIRHGGYDCISARGKKIDVKYTSKMNGDLLVLTSKTPGEIDIYALMTGLFPHFTWLGYATGEEVFASPVVDSVYGHKNYCVRQKDLHCV